MIKKYMLKLFIKMEKKMVSMWNIMLMDHYISNYYYKDDKLDGEYFYYNRAGILEFKGHYKNGQKEGECIYYRGGKIKEKGCYKEGTRIGEWLEYNREGQVTKKVKY